MAHVSINSTEAERDVERENTDWGVLRPSHIGMSHTDES